MPDSIRDVDENAPLHVHVVPTSSGPINIVDTLLRAGDGRPAAEPRFVELHAWARDHVRLVPRPAEANLVLYPSAYADDVAHAQRAAVEADRAGRTCLFFDAGDTWTPFALTEGILYRTSCDRAAMRPNERAMPAFVGDLLGEAGDSPEVDPTIVGPAVHGDRPTVGFCGYVGTPLNRAKFLLAGQVQKWRGLATRHRVVRTLARSPGVQFDAIVRAQFNGGAHADVDRRRERVEFLRNLLGNAYTLCLRGKGNFSFRFYEVLCAARVPLFVDTRCVLPFEDEIDWRTLLAWWDERDLHLIGEGIRSFHRRFDDASFATRQARLRDVWRSHCSPLGFVRQLARRHAV